MPFANSWIQALRLIPILSCLLVLTGCFEMAQRKRYQEDLTYLVGQALAKQEAVVSQIEDQARNAPAVESEYLEKARTRLQELQEAVQLNLKADRSVISKSSGPYENALSQYNSESELLCFLAISLDYLKGKCLEKYSALLCYLTSSSSLDGKCLEKYRTQEKEQSNQCQQLQEKEYEHMLLGVPKYYPAVTGNGPDTKQVLDEEPQAALFLSKSKKNVERLLAAYPVVAAKIIKEDDLARAESIAQLKRDREAVVTANVEYQEFIKSKNLESRVTKCQFGPLFSEMRAGLAATLVLKQWGANQGSEPSPSKGEYNQARAVAMVETLSKATCECLVARVSKQPDPYQRWFFGVIEGERQWDLYGNPQAGAVGMQFLALNGACAEEGTLLLTPEYK